MERKRKVEGKRALEALPKLMEHFRSISVFDIMTKSKCSLMPINNRETTKSCMPAVCTSTHITDMTIVIPCKYLYVPHDLSIMQSTECTVQSVDR